MGESVDDESERTGAGERQGELLLQEPFDGDRGISATCRRNLLQSTRVLMDTEITFLSGETPRAVGEGYSQDTGHDW